MFRQLAEYNRFFLLCLAFSAMADAADAPALTKSTSIFRTDSPPTIDGVRIVRANEDNYGEQALVQWICYEGAAVLDNRFCASARSD